jgi:uncharacterized protein (DUF2249 family)
MSETAAPPKLELDVRPIPAPQKHPKIFGTFEHLAVGESFVLVNDHDPKPLYYQFLAERNGTFSWTYLEQGPVRWRVQIGKVSPEAAPHLPMAKD